MLISCMKGSNFHQQFLLNNLRMRGLRQSKKRHGMRLKLTGHVQCQFLVHLAITSDGSIIQLVSTYSNAYLHVNAQEISRDSAPTIFQNYPSKNSLFRVIPKLRIRTDGDDIVFGDELHFMSIKTEGYLNFVKTSAAKRQESQASIDNEYDEEQQPVENACVSSATCNWSLSLFEKLVIPKSKPGVSVPVYVQGGGFIRLFQTEHQSYINSRLDLSGFEQRNNEQVQLMEYQMDPNSQLHTTSCTTFWQIENKNPFQGGPIQWNQPFRIRHALLDMYLHVELDQPATPSTPATTRRHSITKSTDLTQREATFTIKLKKDLDTSKTGLFIFVPVTATTNQNAFCGSHCRIQHLATKSWLGAFSLKAHAILRKNSSSNFKTRYESHKLFESQGAVNTTTDSLQGPGPLQLNIPESGNPLRIDQGFIISASSEQRLNDYFEVSVVQSHLVQDFRLVHSLSVPIIEFLLTPRVPKENSGEEEDFEDFEDENENMDVSLGKLYSIAVREAVTVRNVAVCAR